VGMGLYKENKRKRGLDFCRKFLFLFHIYYWGQRDVDLIGIITWIISDTFCNMIQKVAYIRFAYTGGANILGT
jgi:hypothetical protein